MNKYLTLIISIILANCGNTKKDSYTYFGGKIINPKTKSVVLYKEQKVIDTLKLTNKNTFMGKLKNITSGLYYFKHGLEHQYVYLQPEDSLLIRLNTWDFDKSLVFSGTNAEKNNILLESFLHNEEDSKRFYDFYKLNSTEFIAKIDSTKNEKQKFLENFKLDNLDESQDFIDILNISLQYPLHTKLENFVRENSIKTNPETLSDNFLTHRNVANINEAALMFFSPYRNYVYANLYADIYQKKLKKGSTKFTIALLENINSKISSPKQKDRLLKHITVRHFYNKSSGNYDQNVFDTYFSFSKNEKDKKKITSLLDDVNKIKVTEKTPSFNLLKPDQSTTSINTLIKDKKTVVYFKGKKCSSNEWISSRAKYLINKNKDVNFVIVNVNNKRDSFINELDLKYQYSLSDDSNAHDFLNSHFPRVLLINSNGIIKNSFASLSSDIIEEQIAGL